LSGVISTLFVRFGTAAGGRWHLKQARASRPRNWSADDETTGRNLKAVAKRITWLQAAEIIGVCDRTMRLKQLTFAGKRNA